MFHASRAAGSGIGRPAGVGGRKTGPTGGIARRDADGRPNTGLVGAGLVETGLVETGWVGAGWAGAGKGGARTHARAGTGGGGTGGVAGGRPTLVGRGGSGFGPTDGGLEGGHRPGRVVVFVGYAGQLLAARGHRLQRPLQHDLEVGELLVGIVFGLEAQPPGLVARLFHHPARLRLGLLQDFGALHEPLSLRPGRLHQFLGLALGGGQVLLTLFEHPPALADLLGQALAGLPQELEDLFLVVEFHR